MVDSGHNEEQPPQISDASYTRRGLLIAGASLALAACSRRGSAPPSIGAAPPPAAAPAAPRGFWYTVENGDTLSAIGRKAKTDVASIVKANKLKSSLIKPGQKLWLPGVSSVGADPLAGLARRTETKAPVAAQPKTYNGGYTIIRRHQWTKAKIKANHRAMNGVKRITIHHTGEYAGTANLSDREIIRRIDRYHREGRKWAAIGYHYLIAPDGRVYEGRPERIQGAHTSNNNSHNLGISMMGDFHRKTPNARHLSVLKKFLDDTRRRLRVPRNRIYGHRDLSPSICPGDKLYTWLKKYRAGQI